MVIIIVLLSLILLAITPVVLIEFALGAILVAVTSPVWISIYVIGAIGNFIETRKNETATPIKPEQEIVKPVELIQETKELPCVKLPVMDLSLSIIILVCLVSIFELAPILPTIKLAVFSILTLSLYNIVINKVRQNFLDILGYLALITLCLPLLVMGIVMALGLHIQSGIIDTLISSIVLIPAYMILFVVLLGVMDKIITPIYYLFNKDLADKLKINENNLK